MTSKELLLAAFRIKGLSNAKVAKEIGCSPQSLSQKLARNSLRADEFLNILESIGVEVSIVDKDTGKPIRGYVGGAGRPVRRIINGVEYSTAKSLALSNNFYSDGINKYNDGRARELYVDQNGDYFFAEYSEIDGEKDRINPVSALDAAEFIEKHGTVITREAE